MEKEKIIVDTKIIESEDKLNKIELDLSRMHLDINNDYEFDDNPARKAIINLGFDNEDRYSFFKTTVNPEADAIIKKNHKKFKIQTCSSCHFDLSMANFLSELIHKLNPHHECFLQVINIGVCQYRHHEEKYWPVIHILKNLTETRRKEFIRSVKCILSDHFDEIEKHENPHNYSLESYQLLRKNSVQPLLLKEGPVFIGADIKKALDWLSFYEYTVKYRGHSSDDY